MADILSGGGEGRRGEPAGRYCPAKRDRARGSLRGAGVAGFYP